MRHFSRLFLPLTLVVVACAAGSPLLAQRGGCTGDEPDGSSVVVAGVDEPGERLVITGRVLDRDGEPLASVRVRVFQTDAEGYYSPGGMDEANARLCGVLRTAADGTFEVSTIRPAPYATGGGPAAHVHFEVTTPDGRRRFDTVHFRDEVVDGDPAAGDRSAGTRPLVRVDGGLAVVFDPRV